MPKGVVLTHINFVSVIASAIAQGTILPRPTDVVIAYLPLAHILELLVEVRLFDEEHPQLMFAHFDAADSTDIMRPLWFQGCSWIESCLLIPSVTVKPHLHEYHT
jgi:acyl-CoA synthetase (AMP-forming)/AMP-acid ligase II